MASTSSKHLTLKLSQQKVERVSVISVQSAAAKTKAKKLYKKSNFAVVVIVSKKVAKLASQRNVLKRRLRHLFAELLPPIQKTSKPCLDVERVVYTRRGASELTFTELKKEVQEIVNNVN